MRLKSLKAQGIKNLEIPSSDDDFTKLEFPEEGKVFIHGLNEAGKSTLFESIYFALFGTALIPDQSKASMSELLAYDRDKALVELEFTIEDSIYRVQRTIDDTKSRTDYSHQLIIEHPGEEPQGVKGASSVNQRIEQEIGLDGDALLNSCFVQQKNLDRLEDSRRQKREDSIATLLNLDRFTALENEYSSKHDTAEEEFEEAQQKLEIAEIEEEKIPEKEEELDEIDSKLDVVQWKKDINENKEDIEGFEGRIEDRLEEIHGLAREVQEINELEEKLPEKNKRLQELEDLYSDFQDFDDLEGAVEELDNLEFLDQEIEEFEAGIDELVEEREELSEKLKTVRDQLEKYEYRDLLDEWNRLKSAVTREDRIKEQREKHRDKKEEAKDQLESVQEQQSSEAAKRRGYGGAGVVIAIAGLLAGFFVSNVAFLGIAIGLVIAGYAFFKYDPGQYDPQIESLKGSVSEHDTELTKLEGREEDLESTESEDPETELNQIESSIEEAGRQVPSTLDECSSLQSELESELEDIPTQGALESKEDEILDEIPREKEIKSRKQELGEMKDERDDLDEEEIRDRIFDLKKEIVGAEKEVEEIEAELQDRCEDLDVEPGLQEVNSAKSSFDKEIQNDEERLDDREEINEQIGERNKKIEGLRDNISEAEEEIEELEQKIEGADSDPDIGQESELDSERDEIVGDLGDLKGRRKDLRDEIGISQDLDLDEVEDEVEQKEHDMKLYEYAEDIVSNSKNQIMRNILPKTQNHMARFLPILTNGRYKDVRIDPESYKIEAYDGRAQTYKSKSIFSGGTKDQFSLALRLSFAMATLPQERGIAPDFLYLDEPVGSFDSNRREALTELLTRGEIAENFGQVFVVSHVDDLKDEFDHRIKMENGQIAEKELSA